jgi:transcriptional regulator with XRE-family HTH domain
VDENQAKELGKTLRTAREALGLNSREVAKAAGIDQATLVRIESGSIAAPGPDKLAKVARVLGISAADLFASADYTVPADLPSFKPYLRTKYGNIPAEELERIEEYALKIAKRNGVSLSGPAPGEDE